MVEMIMRGSTTPRPNLIIEKVQVRWIYKGIWFPRCGSSLQTTHDRAGIRGSEIEKKAYPQISMGAN